METSASAHAPSAPGKGPCIIVALDFAHADAALHLVSALDPAACRLKVGKELFTRAGPELVRELVRRGFGVFLDLKYHDIPNTVAGALRAAAELGVWMVNVHASGGRRMLEAGVAALQPLGAQRPLLTAVTVLTSHTQAELEQTGISNDLPRQVELLTRLALDSGLDGVVCSAQEAGGLRQHFGRKPVLVTPGIRAPGAAADDQRRTLTPREALDAGSDFLVIGRPITAAPDPASALQSILSEISYRNG